MDQSICKLTLIYPPGAGDRIVELMLGLDPPLAGFTTWEAEGHGFGFANASTSERVRGRVKRSVLVAVMKRASAAALVKKIADEAPIPHVAYWIEPVDAFGHLAPSAAEPNLSQAQAQAAAQL